MTCPFCNYSGPFVAVWPDAYAITPLDPVVPGHVIVIPRRHVVDCTEDPEVTATVMWAASTIATPPCNLITSAGREASQTVFHLHVHIVPRTDGDGLALPWSHR